MKKAEHEAKPLDKWAKVTDKNYRMNKLLIYQLNIMVNAVRYDFDCLLIVDGEIEGSGKSVLAQQVGYFFADKAGTKFGLDNIVFTPYEFREKVKELGHFSVIIWDEAYAGANKFRMMSRLNQTISSLLQQIRQKNLFIIVVLPYFFDLTSYIAIPRSWFLLHCYLKPQVQFDLQGDVEQELDFNKPVFERGFFRFYSRRRKKLLYFYGKKEYNYEAATGNFVGMFPKFYTVNEKAYREKKANIDTGEQAISDREFLEAALHRGMQPMDIIKYVNYSKQHIYDVKKKIIKL